MYTIHLTYRKTSKSFCKQEEYFMNRCMCTFFNFNSFRNIEHWISNIIKNTLWRHSSIRNQMNKKLHFPFILGKYFHPYWLNWLITSQNKNNISMIHYKKNPDSFLKIIFPITNHVMTCDGVLITCTLTNARLN